ncbi:MAG: Gmad2 immunoglobulin-like domain-containing protein [Parcubacteria group bacterium]|nr:Gmad2 immunoglobulin-like domain-containing protein [Parcubacteria group bacterium]
MTKYLWITGALIAVVLALAFKQAPNEPEVSRPAEDASQDVISDIPQAEEGEGVVSESGSIKVTRPQPNTTVASPLLVKGEARGRGLAVRLRLKDATGAVMAEKSVAASAAEGSEFGSFGELLLFDDAAAGAGVLEVFSEGAFDGSVQDLVSIPIKF